MQKFIFERGMKIRVQDKLRLFALTVQIEQEDEINHKVVQFIST